MWSVDLEGGEVYRTHVSSLRRTPPLLAGRSLQLPTHRCGGLRANGGHEPCAPGWRADAARPLGDATSASNGYRQAA